MKVAINDKYRSIRDLTNALENANSDATSGTVRVDDLFRLTELAERHLKRWGLFRSGVRGAVYYYYGSAEAKSATKVKIEAGLNYWFLVSAERIEVPEGVDRKKLWVRPTHATLNWLKQNSLRKAG